MEKEKEELFRGEWFLPGHSNTYPGILTGSDGNFKLKVFGKEYLNGEDPRDNNTPRNPEHDVILGKCRISTLVTLYKCEWRGTMDIGEQLHEFEFSVYAVFDGAHVAKPEFFHIKRASTRFPFVNIWYDGWKYMEKAKEALKRGQGYDEKAVQIDGNLSLKYVDYYTHQNPMDGHSIEVTYSKWVDFEYEQEVTFDQALHDWIKFKRMLEFTTMGKEINFTVSLLNVSTRDIEFISESHDTEKLDYITLQVHFNLLGKAPEKKPYIHQNGMLFSRWKVDAILLDQITRQWFANDKYYPVYDYYLDSNNWFAGSGVYLSNVMFNNRFLNLIQGLESYHYILNEQYHPDNNLFTSNRQKVLNLIDDPELKTWINNTLKFPKKHSLLDSLNALIQRFSPYLLKLFANPDYLKSFAIESKNLRHELSHGRQQRTSVGEHIYPNYHIAKILLCLCILESLQIAPAVITKIILRNYGINDHVSDVIFRHRRRPKQDQP